MDIDADHEDLPWGLHDARLERMEIDWCSGVLQLDVRVMTSERQDMDRRARIEITGLVYCVIEPPEIRPPEYEPTRPSGLWIDGLDDVTALPREATFPATPDGCFVRRMYVHDWNRFVLVCARNADLRFLEPAPMPSRASGRALFPGDEVPSPER